MNKLKNLITIPAIVAVSTTLAACGKPNAKNSTKITIYHTNDTHSRVEEGKYAGMGFGKIGTIIDEARKADPQGILLMDAGDTFHGQTFATINKGQSILDIYNALKYDVLAPGNHDFNYGSERLLELVGKANFKILSANTVKEATLSPIMESTTVITKKGIRFGVFGLSTPETAYKTHPDNVKGIKFQSPIDVAKAKVKELKAKGVDFIIAVGHIGIDAETEIKSTDIAKAVPEINLIIDGHSHTPLKNGQKIGNTLVVQTGEYTKNFGKVEIYFDKKTKKLKTQTASLITKESQAKTAEKVSIKEIIAKYKEENKKITEVVVGNSSIKLDGEREQVRTKETNLGNLIADAMKDKASSDFALTNGGGIRKSIDVGPITKGELIEVLPFGNIVVKLEITGAQLKAALENGLKVAPQAAGSFPHISGLKVTYNVVEGGNKVATLTTTSGVKIEDAKTYTIATNDFLAAGGDKYTMFKDLKKVGEYNQLDEALIDYIAKKGISTNVEGRIKKV